MSQKTKEKQNNKNKQVTEDVPEVYFQLIDKMGRFFNHKISTKRSPQGTGSITIHIANDQQAEAFLRALDSL